MRFTNKKARWEGESVPMTVRVIAPVAEVIDAVVDDPAEPLITNRSEAIQDALAIWAIAEQEKRDAYADSEVDGTTGVRPVAPERGADPAEEEDGLRAVAGHHP